MPVIACVTCGGGASLNMVTGLRRCNGCYRAPTFCTCDKAVS